MKRSKIKSLSVLIILMIGLMSCEEVDLTFDQSNAFIAFSNVSGSLSENAPETLTIELYYASTSKANVSVTLEFDATGIDNPAVEGVDFNVQSSKTISFESALMQVVVIEAIDNDVRDKDKSININLTGDGGTTIGMGGGVNGSYLLTIVDNEHPLSNWIGSYNVAADSYGDVLSGEADGAWDEAWEVTTSPVDGDETKLDVVGIAFGDLPVTVTVDLDAMTITFPAGANTGEGYGYGPTLIWKGDYANVEEADVVGTINADGSIAVDLMTMYLPDYVFVWDSFNTTWTPAKKKAARSVSLLIDKMSK